MESYTVELRRHYDDVSARLRNPERIVEDDGIDLRRTKRGVAIFIRKPLSADGEQQIRDLITRCLEPKPPAYPSISRIKTTACAYFGVLPVDMVARRKERHVALARMVSMFLCRRLTPASYPKIAQQHGGRDHTAAMYAFRKIDGLIQTDADLRAKVEAVALMVGGTLE